MGLAAFVAFLPTQAQLSAAISNDGLTTLVCAALFWRLLLLVRDGTQTTRDAGIIAALLGVGLLTKLSVFQLFPAVLLAYYLAARTGNLSTRQAAQRAALAIGGGLLIASPWLLRNTLLYGDPLALSIYKLTGPNFTPDQIMQMAHWTTGDYLRNVGVRSFATFWYLLPPNLPFKQFTGSPFLLLVVLALAGGGLWGVYQWSKTASHQEPSDNREKHMLFFAVCSTLLLVPFFAQFVLSVFQAQGRYFLPVLLPVALVTIAGWAATAKRGGENGGGVWFVPPVVLFVLVLYQLYQLGLG